MSLIWGKSQGQKYTNYFLKLKLKDRTIELFRIRYANKELTK